MTHPLENYRPRPGTIKKAVREAEEFFQAVRQDNTHREARTREYSGSYTVDDEGIVLSLKGKIETLDEFLAKDDPRLRVYTKADLWAKLCMRERLADHLQRYTSDDVPLSPLTGKVSNWCWDAIFFTPASQV